MIPTKKQNPRGLHRHYAVTKADGSRCDPKAEYFVLRLDCRADDWHRFACRMAIHAYADAIENVEPMLAADLRKRYPREKVSLSMYRSAGCKL
jgi:hypothetical protein